MRVSKEKAAENRARILAEAARLFRERGLSGVGVDALTEAAGLTHGSLYSQFGSKERLAAEALAHALASSPAHRIATSEEGEVGGALAHFVSRYLSAGTGMRRAAAVRWPRLVAKLRARGPAVRQAFTRGLAGHRRASRRGAAGTEDQAPEDEALAVSPPW